MVSGSGGGVVVSGSRGGVVVSGNGGGVVVCIGVTGHCGGQG